MNHMYYVLKVFRDGTLFFVVLIHSSHPHSTEKESRRFCSGRSEVVSLSESKFLVEGMKKPYKLNISDEIVIC